MFDKNPFSRSISGWVRRNFSDPSAVTLCLSLIVGLFLFEFFGSVLAPILVSVVVAYLLNGVVQWLTHCRVPHWLAFVAVYCIFIALVGVFLGILLPLLVKQLIALVHQLPQTLVRGKAWMAQWVAAHPHVAGVDQVKQLFQLLQMQVGHLGSYALTFSMNSLSSILAMVMYFVLVPIMVFFFLKDSITIQRWFSRFLPHDRHLMNKVWADVQVKIGAYIRGRVIEVLCVAVVTCVTFWLLGFKYAMLLGAAVGLSTLVPYVGTVAVTVPVVVLGLMQWGMTSDFAYLIIAYVVIIFVDANILVPLLFATSMNLHPVAILIAIVIFGAIWGFWGVFFAIPLATFINAIILAWPNGRDALA